MYFGRPRSAPSWSWVAATDTVIQWPNIDLHTSFQVRNQPNGLNLTSMKDRKESPDQTIHLSGIIQPARIQFHEDDARFMDSSVSWQPCQIIEDSPTVIEEKLSQAQSPNEESHSGLGPTASTQATANANPNNRVYSATFFADYLFWTSHSDFRDILRETYFCLVGVEKGLDPVCMAGMLLRPLKDERSSKMQRFERIGWLSCVTQHEQNSWRAHGSATEFLLA
jgi:hypothetical protein